MTKQKILGAIAAFVVGALGALSETKAMPPFWEISPDGFGFCKRVEAHGGMLVEAPTTLSRGERVDGPTFGPPLRRFHVPAQVGIMAGRCFAGCGLLSYVAFGANSQLTEIGEYAFENCSSLQSIRIPAGVVVIGAQCFVACRALVHIHFEPGSQLTEIGANAFNHCSSLFSICIPAGVRTLKVQCFCMCRALAHVSFERNSQLEEVRAGAFACTGPICVRLPHRVTFGPYPFRGWGSGLVGSSPKVFFGDKKAGDCDGIRGGTDLGIATIPKDCETLPPYCFQDCHFLTFVNFERESCLTVIGQSAFQRCIFLHSICIPASVQKVEERCFSLCNGLFSVSFELGSQLRIIGSRAFSGCNRLQSICIPKGVEELRGECFAGCINLLSVSFEQGSRLRCILPGTFAECSQALRVILSPGGKTLCSWQLEQGWGKPSNPS